MTEHGLQNGRGARGVFDEEPEVARLVVYRELVPTVPEVDPGLRHLVRYHLRAAHAFGAGVALSADTADLYNPKTVRATMGSIFHTPIARRVQPLTLLEEAKTLGFITVAAVPQGGERAFSLLAERLVIVVGAEGGGLPEELVSACQRTVTIPALAASLNAAVAASILLYEAYNRVLP